MSKQGFAKSIESPTAQTQNATPVARVSSFRRLIRAVGWFFLFYVVVVVLGLVPVNNDYTPAPDGVTIYVASNAVHADVILPVTTDVIDWRSQFPQADFKAKLDRCSHVAIGWGDRGFFLNTPQWKDLRASTAANAMFWPSKTVMHVQFTTPRNNAASREVKITREDYEKLVAFVLSSFAIASDARQPIDYSYGHFDAFYDAQGSYHLFNTCNCWVGRALKVSGVRTPWFSPMPKTVLWYLPSD